MKALLRKDLLQKRLALAPEDWERRSLLVCQNLLALPAWKTFERIALYKSFRGEVDLHGLISLDSSKHYYFPVIDKASGGMDFFPYADDTIFNVSGWGLSEPGRVGEALTIDAKTLIIVPALAFDRRGHRLGYGKGFYDHFLGKQKVATAGVCFSEFLLDELPHEAHDRMVEAVVTEEAFFLSSVCL